MHNSANSTFLCTLLQGFRHFFSNQKPSQMIKIAALPSRFPLFLCRLFRVCPKQASCFSFFHVHIIVPPISICSCFILWCIWFLFYYNFFLSRSIAFSYIKTAFQTLDTNFFFSYNKKERISSFACQTRACTGFDGGFEVREAICGPGPHSKPDLKIKRKR